MLKGGCLNPWFPSFHFQIPECVGLQGAAPQIRVCSKLANHKARTLSKRTQTVRCT